MYMVGMNFPIMYIIENILYTLSKSKYIPEEGIFHETFLSCIIKKKKKKRAGNAAQLFVVFLQHLKWYFALGPWAALSSKNIVLRANFQKQFQFQN